MKNLLIAYLIFGALGSIGAQNTKVVVAIGVKQMKCDQSAYSTHLSYSWWSGSDYDYCTQGAKKDILNKNLGHDDISTKWGEGKYLVILSTDKKYETWNSRCDRNHYAVGIGIDAKTAWEKAKNDLPWTWSERDGYKILVDRAIY